MGMWLEGEDELMATLRQVGDKAHKGVFQQMKKEAIAIRDRAREYAPIDHGNLEDAITAEEVSGERNESGQFGRKSMSVFVDMSKDGYHGEPIGQYAYVMHEHFYNLGKRSAQKDAGRGVVGRLYLERAAAEVSRDIMNRLIAVSQGFF